MKTINKHLFDDFIQVQNTVYPSVIKELTEGQKRTHWMWFIFPQVKGLGHSTMARRFAIESLEQAKEYLQHDVLGARLRECAELLLLHPDKSALEIFGSIDTLKLHSSLTLFTLASPNKKCVFNELLDQYFEGSYDINTIKMLKQINDQQSK
ncbi:DUF1810 domain-containing protein [Psychrobacter sp. Sarcosine-3u-12]|uniref:DUF1810 domain-containing protein n=1 Tax=Psychrobacter sp. Sarcosine-3u-12 TaxID=2058325 RepID=UPI000C32867C|nr:DUF1810 domain-containing protein [Psychrobacter sp. Sarcosine-3u-12]PKG34179.1 DUF1810 domain-containing protein [Psychrobacter sp. Sarcosine-3u-12]